MGCSGCGGRIPPVRVAVPKNVPELLGDGSIKFPGDVAKIDGYVQDENDPAILVPTGEKCSQRMVCIMLKQDGSYKPYHICQNHESPKQSFEVDFEYCNKCEFRK